jgi:hypothetical protein
MALEINDTRNLMIKFKICVLAAAWKHHHCIISRNAIMPVVGGGGVEIVDDCHVDDQKFSCAAPAK